MFVPVRSATLVAAGAALVGSVAAPGPVAAAPGTAARPAYQVAARVQPQTVLVGHRVTVTGKVRPRAPERAVKLQVYAEGAWHTVALTELSSERSRYAATYTPPAAGTYTLRVRKPPGDGHRRGTSRTLTVTVTPSLPPQ